MTPKTKFTLALAVGAVVILWVIKMLVKTPVAIDSVAARSKGNTLARIQVVEFIDFQCPACAHGVKILNEHMDKHPQDVRVHIKYFPLIKPHAHAMSSALYCECAARQGKFWEFLDPLLAQQAEWAPFLSADPVFQNIAKQIGLDMTNLNACLASKEAAKTITDDQAVGKSLGVQSTPTYFINNKMVVGAKSLTDELNHP